MFDATSDHLKMPAVTGIDASYSDYHKRKMNNLRKQVHHILACERNYGMHFLFEAVNRVLIINSWVID